MAGLQAASPAVGSSADPVDALSLRIILSPSSCHVRTLPAEAAVVDRDNGVSFEEFGCIGVDVVKTL